MAGKLPLFNTPKLKGKYLDKVLASGHLTAGPMVGELERRLRERTGAGAVICTSSACAAWEAVLRVIKPLCVGIRQDTFPVIHDLIERFMDGTYEMVGVVCLLYTSDAADERSSVDLGGRRI